MKSLIIAALLVTGSAKAEVSAPFQLTTVNYKDYAGVKERVTFVAIAKIKTGEAERFKKIVQGLQPTMRAQAGNISYDLHQSLGSENEFLFVEEWADGRSMNAHMASAAVAELFAKAGSLFESGFPKILILKKNK
jgi:quinol monooxygenase YgiN